jgi:RIO-like serine/threonine protein kinase
MELVKINKEKHRRVFKMDNCYKKVWHFVDKDWLENHVDILEEINPGYILSHGIKDGTMFVCYNIVPGIPANTFEHTKEFVQKIYDFCINNINETAPYAHGDWVLSNILIDGDNMRMVDWDNVDIYPPEMILEKLDSDLQSAFGDKFEYINNG